MIIIGNSSNDNRVIDANYLGIRNKNKQTKKKKWKIIIIIIIIINK